jgi:hypothetical protein
LGILHFLDGALVLHRAEGFDVVDCDEFEEGAPPLRGA